MLRNSFLLRAATCEMVRAEAELISPISIATLSRSIMRCALVEATCGLTESSLISSICLPITPPAALISSAAILAPITAYSPSAPRKPVSGVRWPMRILSWGAWPQAGRARPAAPAAAVPSRRRRDTAREASWKRLIGLSPLRRPGGPVQ